MLELDDDGTAFKESRVLSSPNAKATLRFINDSSNSELVDTVINFCNETKEDASSQDVYEYLKELATD